MKADTGHGVSREEAVSGWSYLRRLQKGAEFKLGHHDCVRSQSSETGSKGILGQRCSSWGEFVLELTVRKEFKDKVSVIHGKK